MINLVRLPNTTHSETGGSGAGNSYDADLGTSYDQTNSANAANPTVISDVYSTHTFSTAYSVYSISYKLHLHANSVAGASVNNAFVDAYVQYYVGGWNTLYSVSFSVSGNGDDARNIESDVIVNLAGVTAVRVWVHLDAHQHHDPASGGSEYAECKIYDISAQNINRSYAGVI